MSSEKLKSDIIRTRDARQEALHRQLTAGYPATLFVSLNLPGADKNPPGAGPLMSWALNLLHRAYPDIATLATDCDTLGPYAVLGIHREVAVVKRRCIELEISHPSARLVDLDVFDCSARQIDRASLSQPPRHCLVCSRTAVECIRLGRHTYSELTERTNELLAYFRN